MKWFKPRDSIIEFRCSDHDWNIIPKPFPSRKFLPGWYKSLVPKYDEEQSGGRLFTSTIKRCPPFLDSMTVGWIIPLVADVQIKSNDDTSGLDWYCAFSKPVIECHDPRQINSEKHPEYPKPPIKFLNYWSIKVPDGWSVLFTPPFNRPDERFTCITGLVDCDKYEEFINFPAFWNKPNYNGILQAGTPLVQAIPIRRDNFEMKSDIHPFSKKEWKVIEDTRSKRTVSENLYRNKLWVKK